MRKPRDYDAELKALSDKARQLRDRKVMQLGELVIAAGADTLAIDVLAGALLIATEVKDAATVEGWRARGAAFFHTTPRARASAAGNVGRSPADSCGTTSAAGPDRS